MTESASKVGFVALHYPGDEHRDAFVDRVRAAAAFMASTPGCTAAECWCTADGSAVVSMGFWVSAEAERRSFVAADEAGIDFAFDERETRPRDIIRLVAP